ncbi:sulfatase family protein [Paenibacillus chungangensis]|uniref:Sulfatase n=1 Tax=Paenibacillus chungangensis TaxID=696535 RepID=A0ABW3HKJ4_9BACL
MTQPNIVFITAHDLGRHLGCYGVSTVATPALDELAATGVLFEQCFCSAPQCSPSRAALHTGRYPHSNGVMGLTHGNFRWRLHPDERHIAEILSENGYDTALIGVQHLTEQPEELGYHSVLPQMVAAEAGEAASDYIRKSASSKKPFYLEVGFFEPHRPFHYGGVGPEEAKGVFIPPYIPDSPEARSDFAMLQGAVQTMDKGIAVILDALRDTGLEGHTWVIFTTDHGIAMPRAKGTLYDPGLEAALIMRYPQAGLFGGRRIEALIGHVDVVPTMLEALGMDASDRLHGQSFWPALQGAPCRPATEIYAEKTYHNYYAPMRCIRTETHKLIVNMEVSVRVDVPGDIQQSPIYPLMLKQFLKVRDHIELYDLRNDPWETENLAGKEACLEVEKSLLSKLLHWMEDTDDPILKGPVPSPYYVESVRKLHEAR